MIGRRRWISAFAGLLAVATSLGCGNSGSAGGSGSGSGAQPAAADKEWKAGV